MGKGQSNTTTVAVKIYTGCPRRNVPDFGRMFLMLKYTDITQNTYVVCPKISCSGLAKEWDVNWWRTPPALFTQQDPVDLQ
jgi:hypothetical protein